MNKTSLKCIYQYMSHLSFISFLDYIDIELLCVQAPAKAPAKAPVMGLHHEPEDDFHCRTHQSLYFFWKGKSCSFRI